MPKKYHIHPKATPLELDYIYKFKIVRGENCINCGKCTKVCIYQAHKRSETDPRKMADPNTVVCRNCFRCIQECPRGALEKSLEKVFINTGGAYWKPDMLLTLFKQAEDGAVPVSGAGYRGPFTGPGFDGMWTDMSEIVRPTRDGIHGREYINTSIDLGRKLNHLVFSPDGQLLSKVPDTVEVSLPILFDTPAEKLSPHIKLAMVKSAAELNTFIIMPVNDITGDFEKYSDNIIPRLTSAEIDGHQEIIKKARIVTIECDNTVLSGLGELREKIKKISNALCIIRVPAVKEVEYTAAKLAHDGAEIIHIVADYRGQELNSPAGSGSRHLKDIIRSVHQRLVEDKLRDEVIIVASGGIALAEHVTKAMLCGADLTAIDLPLMVGLGGRIYEEQQQILVLPEELSKLPTAVITQRMINLIGAWHSQILEMMGAMGIREARRLRGESGRAIFFEEIDRDTFGKLFSK
ncbi:MAG: glutamate synthase-related protein [Dehalococcoidales bacterium]